MKRDEARFLVFDYSRHLDELQYSVSRMIDSFDLVS